VHIGPQGPAEVLAKPDVGTTSSNDTTIIWDPQVEGLLATEAELSGDSRHQGERHLDGDEFIYLLSGEIRIGLEQDGTWSEVSLQAGRAAVVPQGVWHRLLVEEPSRILVFSTGRTEIRPPA
jgi:quercetin dioxygenase-like cupin family protein